MFNLIFLTLLSNYGLAYPLNERIKIAPTTLDIYSMHIESFIKYRYARTTVTSKVSNPSNKSEEMQFSMLIPNTAFITSFNMIINGKSYKAYIKEREKAKEIYDNAVNSGFNAAHINLSARDSNKFTVSVNVESGSKIDFILNYEQLLQRKLGYYSHIININPGQIVRDFQVNVYIAESANIKKLKVDEPRTSNEITKEKDNNKLVKIQKKKNKAHVQFKPTMAQQESLINEGSTEWIGQLIIKYDIDRKHHPGGEILIDEGYFVHFFSPQDLQPLPKLTVFVLDVSGSMEGRKLEQLKEAMNTILDDLNPSDYFNIIEFSYSVTVHDLDTVTGSVVLPPDSSIQNKWLNIPNMKQDDTVVKKITPDAYPATKYYIEKAKQVIKKMSAGGGTNIYDALKNSVLVAQSGLQSVIKNNTELKDKIEPLIIFLTDGDPTVGITNQNKILSMVKEYNSPITSLFSLGFGEGADLMFLKKLSLSNSGFSRTIYEASDAALQLNSFYKEVASPLLSNVTFVYLKDQVKNNTLTKHKFQSLFLGSEFIIAGELNAEHKELTGMVTALTLNGPEVFEIQKLRNKPDNIDEIDYIEIDETEEQTEKKKKKKKHIVTSLEKVWAYLTIQQLLIKQDTEEQVDEKISKQITQLSLKYKFVTPLTSMVVVQPNKTIEITSESLEFEHSLLRDSGYNNFLGLPVKFVPQSLISMEESEVAEFNSQIIERFDENTFSHKMTTLENVIWLQSKTIRNASIELPIQINNKMENYTILLKPNNLESSECENDVVFSGECVHFTNCILEVVANNFNDFMQYFCPIDSKYVGICCPTKITGTTNHQELLESTTLTDDVAYTEIISTIL